MGHDKDKNQPSLQDIFVFLGIVMVFYSLALEWFYTYTFQEISLSRSFYNLTGVSKGTRLISLKVRLSYILFFLKNINVFIQDNWVIFFSLQLFLDPPHLHLPLSKNSNDNETNQNKENK